MRTVYTHNRQWRIYFKDGSVIKASLLRDSHNRLAYSYGEKPVNRIEEHCVKTVDDKNEQARIFEELIQKMGFEKGYHGHKSWFKKRPYLENIWFGKKIFRDEIIGWEIWDTYQTVENPEMCFLQKDLSFNEYSQLIFDREQELRSMFHEN